MDGPHEWIGFPDERAVLGIQTPDAATPTSERRRVAAQVQTPVLAGNGAAALDGALCRQPTDPTRGRLDRRRDARRSFCLLSCGAAEIARVIKHVVHQT